MVNDITMRDTKVLKAFRLTEAQVEILERLAERLQMTYTEVIGLALYNLALKTFKKEGGV